MREEASDGEAVEVPEIRRGLRGVRVSLERCRHEIPEVLPAIATVATRTHRERAGGANFHRKDGLRGNAPHSVFRTTVGSVVQPPPLHIERRSLRGCGGETLQRVEGREGFIRRGDPTHGGLLRFGRVVRASRPCPRTRHAARLGGEARRAALRCVNGSAPTGECK